MNLEPMLNHLWELSHDAKQYSDLVNLCQKEAINNLPQRIVFNTQKKSFATCVLNAWLRLITNCEQKEN